MRLVFIATLMVGALVLLFYMQPRTRRVLKRSRSKAQIAPAIVSTPVNRSIVDRFLFENTFGWEIARIFVAFAPVAVGLLAVWWLMRNTL